MSAAPLSSCRTGGPGTLVAVDFGPWGGPTVRGCGVHAASGYALLHDAGFATTGDAHDGPGIICRLADGAFHGGAAYPTPAQQACVNTPPFSAYWAYWTAPAGVNHWSYSTLGAMGDVPHAGEVQLWTFGSTNLAGTGGSALPRFSPDQIRSTGSWHGASVAAATPTRIPTAGGSSSGLIIAACLAAALAGAAAWSLRRRRRDA